MNFKTFTVIALCLSLAFGGKMNFNLNRSDCKQRSGSRYTLRIPLEGGNGPYKYSYSGLPLDWGYEQDGSIDIPKTQCDYPGSYPVRCSVADANGQVLKTSVVIVVSSNNISVQDRQYDYDYDFSTLGYGSNKVYDSNTEVSKKTNLGLFDTELNSAKGTVAEQKKSSSLISSFSSSSSSISSFSASSGALSDSQRYTSVSSLPSIYELDKIIAAADVVLITRTVQEVISSGVSCSDKVDYLSNFLGRIRSAIQVRKFRAEQVRVIVQSAQSAISELNVQLQRLIRQQSSLSIVTKKEELKRAVVRLQAAYQEFNQVGSSNSDLSIKINQFERQILQITQESTQARQSLNVDQGTLTQIDTLIQELQTRIKTAKTRRTEIQGRIEKNLQIVRSVNTKVTQFKQAISEIEVQIKTQEKNVSTLRLTYLNIQVQVEEIKSSIARLQSRNQRIESEINQLTIKIQNKKSSISKTELTSIEETITILKESLLKIQSKIDSLYYSCRGINELQTSVTQNTTSVIYEVSSSSFLSYIRNVYGVSSGLRLNRDSVQLSPISIFSADWQRVYGLPFTKTGIKLDSTNFSFNEDFACNTGSISSTGQIISINGNRIKVRGDNSKDYNLQLGSCSRIEAAKDKDYMPKSGDHIYWRGNQHSGNNYRISSATCY